LIMNIPVDKLCFFACKKHANVYILWIIIIYYIKNPALRIATRSAHGFLASLTGCAWIIFARKSGILRRK